MSNFPLTSPRDKSHSINGEMTEEQPALLPEVIPCLPPCKHLCDFQDGRCWGQVELHQDSGRVGGVHCCQGHNRIPYGGPYRDPPKLCTLGAALKKIADAHGCDALNEYNRHVYHCKTCAASTGHPGSVTQPLDVPKKQEQTDGR